MRRAIAFAAATSGLIILSGCNSEKDEAKVVVPVRPVLTIVARPIGDRTLAFAGTIQPRYQTDLGFRVLGRIIARSVDVGDRVTSGQMLARLDPLVLDLAVRSSEADLSKARSQLSNATAAEARTDTLLGRQVANQADFDAARQAREAAAAATLQAEANLAKAREQRGYATLGADFDGVITMTDAEVGQTVSPGKKVMTLARTDVREAVVDLQEDVTRSLTEGSPFTIQLQADPSIKTTGKVREIAPQADAATRTRRVRITLDSFSDAFRLGATISATPNAAPRDPAIELPRSALLDRDGVTRVWIVDPAAKTVKSVAVQIQRRDEGDVRVASGLETGARVVVAGVHSLSEGQAVRIDEGQVK